MKFRLQCRDCGLIYGEAGKYFQCPACNGSLSVIYEKNPFVTPGYPFPDRFPGMWKFMESLPLTSGRPISLGEGGTPLVCLEEWMEMKAKVFVKLETLNPTGTYKDRPASVSVSRAREVGARGVAVASDGNAAPAVAAYAARAGLLCIVFMPQGTPKERVIQTAAYGAHIILLDGDINACLGQVDNIAKKLGFFNCSTTVSVNPYQVEADKTISYEIIEQLGACPDWVSVPLGGGSLLCGMVKGMKDLFEAGFIERLPRFLVAQAESCAPFVKAYREKTEIFRERNPLPTLALTIAVPYPPDGIQAIKALELVSGEVVAVNEEELGETIDLLASKQGIISEPSGAASLAGLKRKEREGLFKEEDVIVSVITGTGLKTLGIFEERLGESSIASLPNEPLAVNSYVSKFCN